MPLGCPHLLNDRKSINAKMMANLKRKQGDVLIAHRLLYRHYGILVNNDKVVHFTGGPGLTGFFNTSCIMKTSFADFADGDEVTVEEVYRDILPLPSSEVVNRANSMVGSEKGKYNIVSNNCEHFAHFCKYGQKFSVQVDENGVASFFDTMGKKFSPKKNNVSKQSSIYDSGIAYCSKCGESYSFKQVKNGKLNCPVCGHTGKPKECPPSSSGYQYLSTTVYCNNCGEPYPPRQVKFGILDCVKCGHKGVPKGLTPSMNSYNSDDGFVSLRDVPDVSDGDSNRGFVSLRDVPDVFVSLKDVPNV